MSLFDKKDAFSHFDTLRNKKKQLKNNTIICSYCNQSVKKSDNSNYICNRCNKTIKKEINNNMCTHCEENTIIMYKGKHICNRCGREYGNIISKEQEWRFSLYDRYDTSKSRCTMVMNPLLPSISYRVKRTNSKTVRIYSNASSKKRALSQAYYKMKKHGKKLGINGTLIDKAIYMYSLVVNDITKGSSKKGVMAACQFFACEDDKETNICCRETICQEYNIIPKVFNKGKKEFEECFFSVLNKNNRELKKLRDKYKNPSDPVEIVRKVCNKLNLSDIESAQIIYTCKIITNPDPLKRFIIEQISSKMPHSIASGCILLHLQIKHEEEKKKTPLDIDEISNMCSVSRNTAESTANILRPYMSTILPRDMNDIKDCMPYKKKSNKYNTVSNTPEIIISDKKPIIFKRSRGRPRKVKD